MKIIVYETDMYDLENLFQTFRYRLLKKKKFKYTKFINVIL